MTEMIAIAMDCIYNIFFTVLFGLCLMYVLVDLGKRFHTYHRTNEPLALSTGADIAENRSFNIGQGREGGFTPGSNFGSI